MVDEGDKIFCPICKSEVKDEDNKCPNCGAEFEADDPSGEIELGTHFTENKNNENSPTEKENPYATFVRIIGVVAIVAGVICFLAVIESPQEVGLESVINWPTAIIVLFSGIISGGLCLGFAEVISLLNKIKNRLVEMPVRTEIRGEESL